MQEKEPIKDTFRFYAKAYGVLVCSAGLGMVFGLGGIKGAEMLAQRSVDHVFEPLEKRMERDREFWHHYSKQVQAFNEDAGSVRDRPNVYAPVDPVHE